MSSTCTAAPGGVNTPRRMASGGRTGWRWRSSRSASKRLVPPPRQPDRRADEADHAVGLDEVAPLLPGARIHVLGEQAVAVAAGEQVFEQRPRLVAPSDGGERVDVLEVFLKLS